MAYAPHTLITVGGTLTEQSGQDEIWQIGVRGGNPTTSFAPVDPTQFTALGLAITGTAPTISTWFSAAASGFYPGTKLSFVKIVNVGADGKYTSLPTNISFPAVSGGRTQQAAPSFCSVAYTFRTGGAGRTARNGRVYPPNFGYLLNDAASSILPAEQALALNAAAQFLHCLNKAGAQYRFAPYVVSSQGPLKAINQVAVGSVYDVQRRRKNAVAETYVTATYVPTP
jgi:hypothetical protein